jgi:histidinol-phosphate aminotransferase
MSESAFAIYKVYSKICGLEIRESKVKGEREGERLRDFRFDPDNLISNVDEKTRCLFIDNPNNPTGTYLSHSEIEHICEKVKDYPDLAIVLDNAYEEYVSADDYPDWQKLLKKYKNLLILRTFSKAYGLAGLRVGYCIGNEEVVFYLNQMRAPFNVSRIALASAMAAIDDSDHVCETVELNKRMLEYFYIELDKMGLHYPKSQGNSVLVDVGRSGPEVYERLLDKGVITRPVVGYGFKNHLRICTATESDCKRVMAALKEVLESYE